MEKENKKVIDWKFAVFALTLLGGYALSEGKTMQVKLKDWFINLGS